MCLFFKQREGSTRANDSNFEPKQAEGGGDSEKNVKQAHTGKCIRRFGGIYPYCPYFIDRKW